MLLALILSLAILPVSGSILLAYLAQWVTITITIILRAIRLPVEQTSNNLNFVIDTHGEQVQLVFRFWLLLFVLSIGVTAALGFVAITIIGFGGVVERYFGILTQKETIFYSRQTLLLSTVLGYSLVGWTIGVTLQCYERISGAQETLMAK